MLDSSRTTRVGFVAVWIAVQGALVLTAGNRSAAMGGFRMFSETSTIEYTLHREVAGSRVPIPDGEWNAKDASGTLRHFSWKDRVKQRELSTFGVTLVASYGVDTQTKRLTAALDDVFLTASADAETTRLVLVVVTRKNGHAAETTAIESFARSVRGTSR